MKIRFIGTGSGQSSLKRFHSSLLLSTGDYNLLVDTGDGVSRALLSQKIAFNSINGILISHLHPDHYSGLASLVVQMKISGRENKLELFIHRSLLKIIEMYLRQSYIFQERTGFKIIYKEFEHERRIRMAKDFYFISRQNSHLERYKVFKKGSSLSLSCSSFLFEHGEKNIFYTGDIGSREDLNLFNDRIIKLMIMESSHVSIPDLHDIIQETGGKKILLTHIGDDAEPGIKHLLNSLSKNNRHCAEITYDGMTVNI